MIERRLGEHDLVIPTLYVLLKEGPMKTSDLIHHLMYILNPTGENLDPLHNRNDAKITQIVRNIVSHRIYKNNIINAGLVDYDEVAATLSLTNKGLSFLDSYFSKLIIEFLK